MGAANGATGTAMPARPQVSIAHSSATGRVRPPVAMPHRLGHAGVRLVSAADPGGVFGHVPKQADLVVQLVQMAPARVDRVRRDLAGDGDHRRADAVGGQQGGRCVEDARPWHRGVRLRPARGERRAERHVGRCLLVARVQHAHPAVAAEDGVEQMVVVDAGQGVERVDPVREQRVDGRLGGRHP